MIRTAAPRQLPWTSWEEWDAVRKNLFSAYPHEQMWSVGVVSMWRRRGRVPHAVESTAHLTEIAASDPTRGAHPQWRSENELRLSYALCIVRAVNGLVDPQQQSYFAGSVLGLAAKIGIPGWIVELRHDATHSDMPSLSVLRTAAQTLLAWYEQNYWLRQAEHLRGLSRAVQQPSLRSESVTAADALPSSVEGRSLSLSSFSHIIIPQLISDIVFFELEAPSAVKLFDRFKAKPVSDAEKWNSDAVAFFESSRWRNGVEDVMSQAPSSGSDCLVGHGLARIAALLRCLGEAEDADLSLWRIFVLTCLLAYVIDRYECACIDFSNVIYLHMFDMLDIQNVNAVVSHLTSVYARHLVHGTQRCLPTKRSLDSCADEHLDGQEKRIRTTTDFVFEPVLWPLGSVPGTIETRLYEVEVDRSRSAALVE